MKEEGKKQSPFKKMVTFKNKQWFYPALYVTGAALILIGAMVFQLITKDPEVTQEQGNANQQSKAEQQADVADVADVTAKEQFVKLPVIQADQAVIAKKFYDESANDEARQAALVQYNGQYVPNTGIDVTMEGEKVFDVIASMRGTVISTVKDPVLGNCVTIEHGDGVTTMYQALSSVTVNPGEEVEQGEVIGQSGTSLVNPDLKNYVHFEVRKDQVAINPESVLEVAMAEVATTEK